MENGHAEAEFDGSASATAPTDARPRRSSPPGVSTSRRAGLVLIFPNRPDEAPPVWRVAHSVSVGRTREADVQLDDTRVSRRHASVEPAPGALLVRDGGSRHGTFVNGDAVAAEGTPASAGDVVRIGDALLLVVEDVERFRARPRRYDAGRLGFAETMLAGPLLAEVWDEASRASALRDPVLILGESGSGKECVARILHTARAELGPFVALNASAIPEPLFEAELFGHERGAFTGASQARLGAFREAQNGILFLDEVGELKLDLQAKLLRALDHGSVRPLGAKGDVTVNARVVSATSRDLKQACEAGDFRADLYYRLSGLVIRVPPLRERPDDIILLTLQVLRERSARLILSADAAEALVRARWEGNARQLRHAVAQAANLALSRAEDIVRFDHLPELVPLGHDADGLTLERIQGALARSAGVVAHAARALGVSRTTFYKALKRLDPASALPVSKK